MTLPKDVPLQKGSTSMFQRFLKMNIDHAAIGLAQRQENTPYFCTPKNAHVLGWAGVDGIHYCTIPEFGEMVFAVSPMNLGDYVHPIARDFRELLCMLLACGDMAALEQCYAWDREQYEAFLLDFPVTEAQRQVLDTLRKELDLEPVADVYGSVKALQRGFDLSRIPYTEDYYDPDMNPAAPVPKEWKVTYDGGFWGGSGKAGTEISLEKHFRWEKESWYIPAVYLCGKGLVVDLCKEVDPAEMQAYIDKWDLYNEAQHRYTKEQQEQLERENPLCSDFRSLAIVNGKELYCEHGYGETWIPARYLPSGSRPNPEAEQAILHYGLDPESCWEIRRCCFPWQTARKPKLKTLCLELEREPERITGACFDSPEAGESVALVHPQTGAEYLLGVQEYENKTLPDRAFPGDTLEYPMHYRAMAYTLTPPLPGLMIRDSEESEPPRQKIPLGLTAEEAAALALIGGSSGPSAASVAIIGGSDGPTALILGGSSQERKVACSALRFEAVEKVRWEAVFSVKQMEDLSITVLG